MMSAHLAETEPLRATALAHPNIALVKYWGKRDASSLNLPAAGSLSVTLAGMATTTTVEFRAELQEDEVRLSSEPAPRAFARRVSEFLDLVRAPSGATMRASVETSNDFPTAAGLASSASGFAALALAATEALGTSLSPRELSQIARRGSGSAARSIFGGFVALRAGSDPAGDDCYAEQAFGPDHWPLACVVAVVSDQQKAIASTEGMRHTSATSPYYEAWLGTVDEDLKRARTAIEHRDLEALAAVAEASALAMHASALAARPGLLYFKPATVACMHEVWAARARGLSVFLTIDAGPNVKVFCEPSSATEAESLLQSVPGVVDVRRLSIGGGARILAAP